MISLLLPSRGRPKEFKRLLDSVVETASNPLDIEVILRVDLDDPACQEYFDIDAEVGRLNVSSGGRDVLSKYWNECYELAEGPIYMHCGDDIIFRTPGWDQLVEAAFDESKDKILFVHGRDGIHDAAFGTHGFIHKNWVDTVGYFVPPYFSSDWNDTWLNDVANALGRRLYLPFYTEHMHFVNGKAPLDRTHKERMERGERDGVDALYQSIEMIEKRRIDVEKLQAKIGESQ